MKNVAGYDVSRLLAGSLGTLGLILEVSLKVLPRPAEEVTLQLELSEEDALEALNRWAGQPLPISASAWRGGELRLRLSGAASAVRAAAKRIGGKAVADPWAGIREHTDPYFAGDAPLWRLSVPARAPALRLQGDQLIEWGGALRWLRSRAEAAAVRAAAERAGGHATLFRAQDKAAGAFAPLSPALLRLHRELKAAFDPAGIFNRGRLHPDF
jgi:glycolate oxidase FAD binding subunit